MADTLFMNSAGSIVPVPAEKIPDVVQLGWSPATPQQIEEFNINAKYGSTLEGLKAFGEHAASALTLGLSDVAEKHLGISTPEAMAGREHANPLASFLGSAAGIAGPLIASAGTSALAGVAKATAPGLIARAGQAVSTGVKGALPEATSLLGRAGTRAAALGAGGAAEGALYGIGNVVHESALGDPNLTAQGVLAHIGITAALGGALGGLVGAGEVGLTEAVAGARTAIGKMAQAVSNPAELQKAAQEQYTAMRSATKQAHASIRPEEISQTIITTPEAAQDEALRLSEKIYQVSREMRAQPEMFSGAVPEELEKWGKAILRDSDGAWPEEVRDALVRAKRGMDERFSLWTREQPASALDAVRGIRTEIKSSLENPEIWGPAASREASFNSAISENIDLTKQVQKAFMRKTPGKTGPRYDFDGKKLAKLSDTANEDTPRLQSLFDDWQQSNQRVLTEIEESAKNAPTSDFDREALDAVINKTGELQQAEKQQGAIRRMLSKLSGVGPMGTLAGGAVGGAPGAMIGAALDVVGKGAKYIPKAADVLAKLHANNEAVQASIEKATAVLVKGGTSAARVGRGEVSAGLAAAFGDDAETATAKFHKQAAKLRLLTADPEQLQNALEGMTADLHSHAPQTAQALNIQAATAVSYLSSKLPQTHKPGPIAEELPISQDAIASFNRHMEIANSPLRIYKIAAAGMLTPEHIETFHTLYAPLAKSGRAALVAKLKPDMPYSQRLMVSLLLGQDLDGSTTPQAMQQNQRALMSSAQRATPPAPSRAAPITLSERTRLNSRRAVGEEK